MHLDSDIVSFSVLCNISPDKEGNRYDRHKDAVPKIQL